MLIIRQQIQTVFRRFSHVFIDEYKLSSTGISVEEFRQRRSNLVQLIRNYLVKSQKSSKDFTVCLPSAVLQYMGPDVVYLPFKQQADFYYLTGCLQPNAYLLLHGNENSHTTHLYLSPCSMSSIDDYQRWCGPVMTDQQQICDLFQVDSVQPVDQLGSINNKSQAILFYNSNHSMDQPAVTQKYFQSLLNQFSSTSRVCGHLQHFLHALRSIKSSNEQTILRQVCQWTCETFRQTMSIPSKSVDNEALIKARFQYECEKNGCLSLAFYPVVAANGRSNILHYQKNNQPIGPTDLIMLDAGASYRQYSSDITRLWPLNGRFSDVDRQLYEILLTVQKHLIDALNVSNRVISRTDLNTLADRLMIKYLREELILSRTMNDLQANVIIKKLCPTSASHHLGLDVHDCESIPFGESLRPGNVITIEPGLYIPWNFHEIPKPYRGFASRIEDDVLITEQGCEVLTKDCPKEVDDLYKLLDQRMDG